MAGRGDGGIKGLRYLEGGVCDGFAAEETGEDRADIIAILKYL